MELNKSIKKAWQFRNYTEIAMFTFYLKEKKNSKLGVSFSNQLRKFVFTKMTVAKKKSKFSKTLKKKTIYAKNTIYLALPLLALA